MLGIPSSFILSFNLLSAHRTKWSNTLKQFVGKLATNCLSVFDHFVRLALKRLTTWGERGAGRGLLIAQNLLSMIKIICRWSLTFSWWSLIFSLTRLWASWLIFHVPQHISSGENKYWKPQKIAFSLKSYWTIFQFFKWIKVSSIFKKFLW